MLTIILRFLKLKCIQTSRGGYITALGMMLIIAVLVLPIFVSLLPPGSNGAETLNVDIAKLVNLILVHL